MSGRIFGRPYRRDPDGIPIQGGGSKIVDIINTAVDTSNWTAITIPTDTSCKAILAHLRSGNQWLLSHTSAGTKYFTMSGTLSMDIASNEEEVLFYVKAVSGADTMEVILLD